MKVMVIVKATQSSEAGELPSEQLLTAMGHYNEALSKAEILLAGEGLHPSSSRLPCMLLRHRSDGHRRAVCRDQGTGGWILALAGAVNAGSHRLGQTLSEPAQRGERYRDSVGVRGGRLR